MIRSLVSLVATLPSLPDDRVVTMKLFYFDELTPADYQPKFFRVRFFRDG